MIFLMEETECTFLKDNFILLKTILHMFVIKIIYLNFNILHFKVQ
jgi:hypothetical protein